MSNTVIIVSPALVPGLFRFTKQLLVDFRGEARRQDARLLHKRRVDVAVPPPVDPDKLMKWIKTARQCC